MRKGTLNKIVKAKATFEELISDYTAVLPANIVDGGRNTIDIEIPKFVNNFLMTLNSVEQEKLYNEVKNIDEAIELFEKPELDISIEKAIENKTIVGVGTKGTISAKEILEACVYGVNSGLQLLEMQLSMGKLIQKDSQ